jgi:hypothetical protein
MNARSMRICWSFLFAFIATDAASQPPRPTTVAISGGVTALTPRSELGRVPGGHVQASLSRRMESVLSSYLRVDAGYHSLEGRASPFVGSPSSDVWIATASVVKEVVPISGFRPYVMAGLGTISIDQGQGNEAHLNFAGGVGVAFPQMGRLRPFIEGRYHRAMTGGVNSFIPVSVGIAF